MCRSLSNNAGPLHTLNHEGGQGRSSPQAWPPSSRCQPTRGFTLLEIMLVLVVVVVIAAMSLPALRGPLENQKLRRAADQLHAEWNKTRNRSMKTGNMHVFRFQPSGSTYEIRTWLADEDAQPAASSGVAGFGSPAAPATKPTINHENQLPDDITFFAGDTATETRSMEIEQQITAEAAGAWSRPILFYPDGTTSTARVVLVNKREYYITLNLRGLTGITQITDLQSATELQTP